MEQKSKKNSIGLVILVIADIMLVAACVIQIVWPSLHFGNIAVLNPKGIIAVKERGLIITAVLLMLVAVVPAYVLLFLFAVKYRAGKVAPDYSPDLDSNRVALLLWVVPVVVIFAVGVVNWKSTHALDPYRPIVSSAKPITIQVVALRWKWLFVYPDFNIATVNFIEFPQNTPINFELTADDAPMNSFWIPQLGGQMYAMAGMSTKLHLMADKPGEFNGSAAEINGSGLAGMRFVAKAVSQTDFDSWVTSVKKSSTSLTSSEYEQLIKPSENNPRILYSSADKNLYNNIVVKYMMPQTQSTDDHQNSMPGMDMNIK